MNSNQNTNQDESKFVDIMTVRKPLMRMNLGRDRVIRTRSGANLLEGRHLYDFKEVDSTDKWIKLPDRSLAQVGLPKVGSAEIHRLKRAGPETLGRRSVAIKIINTNKRYTGRGTSRYESIIHRIKRFMTLRKIEPTNENIAIIYNRVIQDLISVGVPLPSMRAIIDKEGKLVILSEYFGVGTKSHLTKEYPSNLSDSEIDELVDIWAKTINAGYVPTPDFVERKEGGGFVPLDIDAQVLFLLDPFVYTGNNFSKMISAVLFSFIHNHFGFSARSIWTKLKQNITNEALRTELDVYFKATEY